MSRTYGNNARDFQTKLNEEDNQNFDSDKSNSLNEFRQAKFYLERALVVEEKIQTLRSVISPYNTRNTGAIDQLKKMIAGLEKDIEFVRNMEPKKTLTLSSGSTSSSGRSEYGSSSSNGSSSTSDSSDNDDSNEYGEQETTYNKSTQSNQSGYDPEELKKQVGAKFEAGRQMSEGDTEGAIRTLQEAGLYQDAAAVPMAQALSQIELGDFKAQYGTLMAGLSVSNSEGIPADYGVYSASITMQGKGRFFAMEFGAKYSDSYYYEAIGFVFGVGFGIGTENTGVMFFGGLDAYLIGISDSEEYLDEDGESGLLVNYGLPYNFSATLYHGVAEGLGLTLGIKHYLGDASLNSIEDSPVLPNPYPSTHIALGLAF